jgi:hypothetical protein
MQAKLRLSVFVRAERRYVVDVVIILVLLTYLNLVVVCFLLIASATHCVIQLSSYVLSHLTTCVIQFKVTSLT